jgi:hypothetical protein
MPFTTPTLLQRAQARATALVRQHLIDDDPREVLPWEITPPPELRLRQGWELEPVDPPHPLRLYAVVIVTVLAVVALAGCGGGGDDPQDPAASTQPVDCHAHPELCQ